MNKKSQQLGMPHGTASSRLHKSILFDLIKKLNLQYCFKCGEEITDIRQLSIEHKIPYLDSEDPVKLFFDLDNIAFSHLSCNCRAAKRIKVEHGRSGYEKGCRCNICNAKNTESVRRYREKLKLNK